MRVICIDAKPKEGCVCDLTEGDNYEVVGEASCGCCWKLLYDNVEAYPSYKKSRFIPLSSIDETEMVREIEIQVTKN